MLGTTAGCNIPGGSHQRGVEGQNPIPHPAGHTALDAAHMQSTENLHIDVFRRAQVCAVLLIGARTYLLLTAFPCRVGRVDYGQGNAQGI